MADFLLGMLAMNAASAVIPMLANGLLSVKRPKRVDITKARMEAGSVRPVIPYRAPCPYTGGRVRALFIGINYTGTRSQLSGCVNDVRQMLGTLQRIAFPISECCILVDDPQFPNFTGYPTRANIIKYMAWLTADVRPGDVLFLHYSGHGGQTKSAYDSEEAYDQCLIPLDYESKGSILDDDLFLMLVRPLPSGARMTCVFDCCHSATMLDLPFSFISSTAVSMNRRHEMRAVRRNNFSDGDVIMFSGCEDAGTSADVANTSGFGSVSHGAGGAATQAFTWALINTQGLSFLEILLKTRDILLQKRYKQVPQLTSSKPVDLYKPFSLFGSLSVDQHMMQQYVPPQYQQPPPSMPPPPPNLGYPCGPPRQQPPPPQNLGYPVDPPRQPPPPPNLGYPCGPPRQQRAPPTQYSYNPYPS